MLVSRRDLLRACQRHAPVLGLSTLELGRVESRLANPDGRTCLWLEGSGCSGCSVPFLNYVSSSPPRTAAEVVRVIHSFDPCLSCEVHVMRPAEDARIFVL